MSFLTVPWAEIVAFLQIIMIDVSLASDNAIAVGMAATGLPTKERKKAVLAGVIVATILRIIFAIFAVQIFHITGLLAAGGLLLLWVAWKLYREIRHLLAIRTTDAKHEPLAKTLTATILQIAIADVSMSLDNVLAVAGVARGHLAVLIAGLSLSVLLMGVAAAYVAKLTARYPGIAYVGLAIILFTSVKMMWDGTQEIIHKI
jgi:YjbE family integral membrane protein